MYEGLKNFDANAEKRVAQVHEWRRRILEHKGRLALKDDLAPEELKDIKQAVDSVYLEYLWYFFKMKEPLQAKVPRTPNFWHDLHDTLHRSMRGSEQHLIEIIVAHANKTPATDWTQLEDVAELMSVVFERLYPGQPTGVPIIEDLNHMGTRLLEALAVCYEQKYGDSLPGAEYVRFTNNKALERILVQLQSNTSESITPFMHMLGCVTPEGERTPFNPGVFVIDKDQAQFGFSPSFLKLAHIKIEQYLSELRKVRPQPAQRNCPVVYMGNFSSMWRWLIDLTSYQLYDTPYPSNTSRSPTMSTGTIPESILDKDIQTLIS